MQSRPIRPWQGADQRRPPGSSQQPRWAAKVRTRPFAEQPAGFPIRPPGIAAFRRGRIPPAPENRPCSTSRSGSCIRAKQQQHSLRRVADALPPDQQPSLLAASDGVRCPKRCSGQLRSFFVKACSRHCAATTRLPGDPCGWEDRLPAKSQARPCWTGFKGKETGSPPPRNFFSFLGKGTDTGKG